VNWPALKFYSATLSQNCRSGFGSLQRYLQSCHNICVRGYWNLLSRDIFSLVSRSLSMIC